MNNALLHFGVKGMRWGHRKASTASADHLAVSGLRKKKLHEMSNDELTQLTKRLQLEKQYKDLNKTKLDVGKKIAGDIVVNVAKQAAVEYIKKYSVKIIEGLVGGILSKSRGS